jgi:hypothetical protein
MKAKPRPAPHRLQQRSPRGPRVRKRPTAPLPETCSLSVLPGPTARPPQGSLMRTCPASARAEGRSRAMPPLWMLGLLATYGLRRVDPTPCMHTSPSCTHDDRAVCMEDGEWLACKMLDATAGWGA